MTFKLQLREDRPATIEEHRALRDGNARLRAALTETLAEVVEIRKNITDARQYNYEAIAHPKFDETYQREMARMDAMIGRARNVLKDIKTGE